MNLIKKSITRVMVALAAITFAVACNKGGEVVEELPNLSLKVEVEDITATTAKIKVSHSLEADNTWYGFITDDVATDAETLVLEAIAQGISAEDLHRSKQYVVVLETLTADTSYRYIATGVTADGKQYGAVSDVEFKTLSAENNKDEENKEEEEYNGMRRNDAWTVMYVGSDTLNNTLYDHVIRVISTDNNSYAITLVYAEDYDPYQLRGLADALCQDLKEFLAEYNQQNATSFSFGDMLYTGNGADPFDLDPGLYRAIAVGYTAAGEVSGLYSVSDEFEVKEQLPTASYLEWIGRWDVSGQNKAVNTVQISKHHANRSFYMTGWEGFDDLAIEVEYSAELNSLFFYSQLVAEQYDLGEQYGKADIYLFAGDEDGYYYDNEQGDYYISIAGVLDDGSRAIARYGLNVPGYPKFTQMFFMADIDGKYYTLTKEEDVPSFLAFMTKNSTTVAPQSAQPQKRLEHELGYKLKFMR